eukprot:TRINITY_DN25069_c0_g2_i1.p1 TRINITY_DN25069_c0_g2~~TRINITY_DN25069_c0_g2_i1.p1  ORF type:complete len:667 (+),score=82.67 TRINITY_DN25069_c0_g2_i1:109-2109(+)
MQHETSRKLFLINSTRTFQPSTEAPVSSSSSSPSSGIWTILDKLVLTDRSCPKKVRDVVVTVLLAYTATVFPFQLAFWDFRVFSDSAAALDFENPLHHPFWQAAEKTVSILFWLDLLLNFFCSYTEKDIEVVSSKKIFWRYLTGYFCIDLIACVPAQAFASLYHVAETADTTHSSSPANLVRVGRLARMQRLSRLFRLLRLAQLVKIMKCKCWNDNADQKKFVHFSLLIFGLLILIHIMACGMYLCAALHEDVELTWLVRRPLLYKGTDLLDATPWTAWAHSMYFVLTVFTTVGFGDISAFTVGEMAYVSMLMLVGMVINSLIVGEILSVITGMDHEAAKIAKLQEAIDQFANVTGLDEENVQRFKKSVLQLSKGTMTQDSEAMRGILKRHLSTELLISLAGSVYGGKLKRNRFILAAARNLEYIPPRLPLLAATLLTRRIFSNGTPVFMAGELALGIYLVQKGTFAHMHAGFPYWLYSFNNYFGDYEVFNRLDLRTSEVRCQSTSGELLYLPSESLSELSQQFPSMEQVWRGDAKRRFACVKRSQKEVNLDMALDVEGLAVGRIVRWWRELPRSQSGQLDKDKAGRRARRSLFRQLAATLGEKSYKKQDGVGDRDRIANCEQAVHNLHRDMNERFAGCERTLGRILSCLEKAGLAEDVQETHKSL